MFYTIAGAARARFGNAGRFGLGTAAFLAFLMSICDRDRAATEYALLSAAYGLTGTITASASGAIATLAGYATFFWHTVALALPALVLIGGCAVTRFRSKNRATAYPRDRHATPFLHPPRPDRRRDPAARRR